MARRTTKKPMGLGLGALAGSYHDGAERAAEARRAAARDRLEIRDAARVLFEEGPLPATLGDAHAQGWAIVGRLATPVIIGGKGASHAAWRSRALRALARLEDAIVDHGPAAAL